MAARIAAGEVVERPASVVKELVENALDAGATRVSVEVQGGGLELIRVTDDGCGIEAGELATAFERHATSKFEEGAEVGQVRTLGFRGEALPSIAAVAEVEVVSRPSAADGGAYLRLGPQVAVEEGARGAPGGTSITVRKLFGWLPARRKFLRTPGAEANAVAQVVTHYALAYPEVRFRLAVDGRQTLHTPGSGDLRDAVAAVYGFEVAEGMLGVAPGEGPVRVTGLASPPHISRASRSYIAIFVNRRWIQSRRLAFAVEDAYAGMLMVGRHPIAVLNVSLPLDEVDVNVHPTKAEVRFRDESAVFGAVQRAVRAAVVAGSPVPVGVRGASPLVEAPELILSAPAWSPPLWEAGVRRDDIGLSSRTQREWEREAVPDANADGGENGQTDSEGAASLRGTGPAAALPVLRVIGQFGNIYVLAEGPDGMYMIDQHAAHERVLYEHFCALRIGARPETQGLLEPLALDVAPRLRALLAGEAEALAGHGFEVEPFGEGTVVLRALPRALSRGRRAGERAPLPRRDARGGGGRPSGPGGDVAGLPRGDPGREDARFGRDARARPPAGGDAGAAYLPARPADDDPHERGDAGAGLRAALDRRAWEH